MFETDLFRSRDWPVQISINHHWTTEWNQVQSTFSLPNIQPSSSQAYTWSGNFYYYLTYNNKMIFYPSEFTPPKVGLLETSKFGSAQSCADV